MVWPAIVHLGGVGLRERRGYPSDVSDGFIRQTGLGRWRRSLLRVEGELALPLICDDLLAGSSLL